MNVIDLPFNDHVGLRLARYEGQEVVCLEPQEHHKNHVGTLHAAALYSLAEAASGHALLQSIERGPKMPLAVLRSANVKYRRPANGRMIAIASPHDEVVSKFEEQLREKGRSLIDIGVRVIAADGLETMTGDFKWFVSRQ